MGTSHSKPNDRLNCDTLSYVIQANRSTLISLRKRFEKIQKQRQEERKILAKQTELEATANEDTSSEVVDKEREKILKQRKKIKEKRQFYLLQKEDFENCLNQCRVCTSDREIFNRFFVLYDKTGLEQVNYKHYLLALCPVVKGSLHDRIKLALMIEDEEDVQILTKEEVEEALSMMNKTLGLLGDEVSKKRNRTRKKIDNILCLYLYNCIYRYRD